MKKHGILGVAASIVLMACLLMVTASAAFAADQMTLSISPDKTAASVGDTVTYTYVVTNNSTDNISGLSLFDDKLGSVALSAANLLPGENATGTKSYVITVSNLPGPFNNTATVAGILSAGDNITTAAYASVSINPLNSAIQVVKSANKTSATAGDNITYTYAITNSGTTALTGLVLTDSKMGAITLSVASLAAGENTTATRTYTVVAADFPGPLTNTATLTAKDPSNATVTATSNEVSIALTTTSIGIVKSANRESAVVGDTITYTYTITNSGDTALTGLVLTDSKLGAITVSVASLNAGASTTATRTYTVVEADLPGPLTNTATVTAIDPSQATITATSNMVSVKLTSEREGRTKAEVLKNSGVPGKGIDNAPGLQKPFNPKSQAFENAGKKDKDKDDKEFKGNGNNKGNGKK